MTDEEIMELCRSECEAFRWPSSAMFIARAIEQKVREECAVIGCDNLIDPDASKFGEWNSALRLAAKRIRARGKK